MYEYLLELFFYKEGVSEDIKTQGLQLFPELDNYSPSSKLLTLSTWENYKNAVLVDYPDVAYILVQGKKLLMPIDEYVLRYETEDFEIKSSKIHGLGVFPKRDLEKDEVIIHLDGELVSVDNFKGGYPKGEWNAISDTTYLVRKERTLYGFINHSLTPNAKILMGELIVCASDSIKKGEEITIDYTKEKLSDSYLKGHGATYLY